VGDSIGNHANKEVENMPNIKSAKKRVKVTKTKTLQNKMFRSQMKTDIKKYEAAVAAGDMAAAQELYKAAVKKIDVAASKGIIHKNCAAHKKSAFTKALNAMKA
jgi:small subunit ribosomal protein S20